MKKINLIFIFSIFSFSLSYPQTKSKIDDVKNPGSKLMEYFYIMKNSISLKLKLATECKHIKDHIHNTSIFLQTSLDKNKIIVPQKLGTKDLKEFENFIAVYQKYSTE